MVNRKEQTYNRINAYIKNYGVQSFIKMTPHAIEKHIGLSDEKKNPHYLKRICDALMKMQIKRIKV